LGYGPATAPCGRGKGQEARLFRFSRLAETTGVLCAGKPGLVNPWGNPNPLRLGLGSANSQEIPGPSVRECGCFLDSLGQLTAAGTGIGLRNVKTPECRQSASLA